MRRLQMVSLTEVKRIIKETAVCSSAAKILLINKIDSLFKNSSSKPEINVCVNTKNHSTASKKKKKIK